LFVNKPLEEASMFANCLILIASYLIGSIPFGFLLVKFTKGKDVRKEGSGNIGMTNVWRVAGAGWGITTFFLDVAKGALATAMAYFWAPNNDAMLVFSGLAVLLGSVFSLFLKFKGGKGVGVSAGVFFSLLPLESAIGTAVLALTVLITRMISAGSLLGVLTMAGLTFFFQKGLTWFSALALLALMVVWWTHRQNIQRIMWGMENKIGNKSKKQASEKK
jgi:glycerol-3-phosphate acyltransferase PlsY